MTRSDTERKLEDAEMRIDSRRRAYEQRVGQARAVADRGRVLEQEILDLQDQMSTYASATTFLTEVASERQADIQTKIEAIVSYGLESIFQEKMDFSIVTSTRGKLPTVDFLITSKHAGQQITTSIMDSRGGGVAAVAGFLLRLTILMLTDGLDNVLVLDESFAQVSENYAPRLADFIRDLCDKTNIQVLLVTHSTSFLDAADTIYEFSVKDGATVATKAK